MKCERDCYFNVGNNCKYSEWANEGIKSNKKTECEHPLIEMKKRKERL